MPGRLPTPPRQRRIVPRLRRDIYVAICICRKPILNSVSSRSFSLHRVLFLLPRSSIPTSIVSFQLRPLPLPLLRFFPLSFFVLRFQPFPDHGASQLPARFPLSLSLSPFECALKCRQPSRSFRRSSVPQLAATNFNSSRFRGCETAGYLHDNCSAV